MYDLYDVFRQRLAAGISSLHPHRWLATRFSSSFFLYLLDCNLQSKSLFAVAEEEGSPLVVIGDVPIVDAEAGRRVLRAWGRQSRRNTYLANARLSWDYRTHRTDGAGVQDALKDLLKERIPSLRLKCAHRPAQLTVCQAKRSTRSRASKLGSTGWGSYTRMPAIFRNVGPYSISRR